MEFPLKIVGPKWTVHVDPALQCMNFIAREIEIIMPPVQHIPQSAFHRPKGEGLAFFVAARIPAAVQIVDPTLSNQCLAHGGIKADRPIHPDEIFCVCIWSASKNRSTVHLLGAHSNSVSRKSVSAVSR